MKFQNILLFAPLFLVGASISVLFTNDVCYFRDPAGKQPLKNTNNMMYCRHQKVWSTRITINKNDRPQEPHIYVNKNYGKQELTVNKNNRQHKKL